jgi:hypothetical protein
MTMAWWSGINGLGTTIKMVFFSTKAEFLPWGRTYIDFYRLIFYSSCYFWELLDSDSELEYPASMSMLMILDIIERLLSHRISVSEDCCKRRIYLWCLLCTCSLYHQLDTIVERTYRLNVELLIVAVPEKNAMLLLFNWLQIFMTYYWSCNFKVSL